MEGNVNKNCAGIKPFAKKSVKTPIKHIEMRKYLLLSLVVVFYLTSISQENNTWRMGIQTGFHSNKSKFYGGMSNANARFHQNRFGAIALDFIVRYDINPHWKIESGLNFNRAGFEFTLAENYSFTQRGNRYSRVRTEFGMIEIPAMISYKFKPDCKNKKWFVSAGFAGIFIPEKENGDEIIPASDGPASSTYLSAISSSNKGKYVHARFMIGREKVFKKGNILSAALVLNLGVKEMIHTTAKYTVDGTEYNHEFTNKGSFIGLRVAYYLRPFKTQKTTTYLR